jgi:hypothetical protein
MPATERRSEGKTAFVREVLRQNPHANAKTVRDEWAASGRSGTISPTLVNKQRSALGLAGNLRTGRPKRSDSAGAEKPPYTGKKRGRKPKSASANRHEEIGNGMSLGGPKSKSGRHPAQLSQIEADIDRLLFRVMALGGLENIEDSLRQTRRLLYRAFPDGRS